MASQIIQLKFVNTFFLNSIKKLVLLFLVTLVTIKAQAQIAIGINSPDPSAILHVQHNSKGLLIPRMTALERTAINSPAEGLLVYQTNDQTGFWYFTNSQWKALVAPNNGGKHTLYLADKITNAQALAKIITEVGPNTQEVRIIRCTQLTTVDLSMVTGLNQVYISDNPVLQSVNFDNLESVDGGFFIDKCPLLSGMPMGHLKNIGLNTDASYAFKISNTAITNINLPLLEQVTGAIYISDNNVLTSINCPQLSELVLIKIPSNDEFPFYIQSNTSLTSIALPLLTNVGDLFLYNNINLATLNVNSLTTARRVSIYGTLLSSVSFPALTSVSENIGISNNTPLTTINLPLLTTIGTYLDIGQSLGLTSISLPQLTTVGEQLSLRNTAVSTLTIPNLITVGNLNIATNSSLSSLSLPSLTSITSYVDNTTITGNTNLTSVSINALVTINNLDLISFAGCKLPSSQINSLLNKFVSITPPLSNRTFDFRQSIPASPTGQGISDKATLIARPNTVYTD